MIDYNFFSYIEFSERYPAGITWLDYESLKNMVPIRWLNILKAAVRHKEVYVHKYDMLIKVPGSKTKLIYRDLTGNVLSTADAYNRWTPEFKDEISFEYFSQCFPRLYKISNITKLRDFQFRLLHKKVPSNQELCKWKIKASSKCNFCDDDDNMEHMLFNCCKIEPIWGELCEYIKEKYNVVITLSFVRIVLNDVIIKPNSIINLLVLVMKQLIYRYKCAGEMLTFKNFLMEITLIRQAEYLQAKQSNKIALHNQNWENETKPQIEVANLIIIIIIIFSRSLFIANYVEKM